jgi:hypothetical protein
MNSDCIYGCFSLNTTTSVDLPVPFGEPSLSLRTGEHLPYTINTPGFHTGSFILAAPNPRPTVYVPQRNEKIDIVSVGKISQGEEAVTTLLLVMNSEPNDMKLADLIHEKIYTKLEGTFLACISLVGDHSKLIFLARNIEMHMLGMSNQNHTFLVWSNEENLEERMREAYDNEFFYYRFPVFKAGSMVLQSQYLCARYKRWKRKFSDSLHVFSAMENLIRKTIRT